MKSIEIASGGPIIPRSKSRAIVRSVVNSARSRWAIPGGGDAHRDQTVVEVRRHAIAEVRRHHLMERLRDEHAT
jgi:hypothetical protein